MLRAFFTSATGMRAQELLIDNTANNLANVNTTAFKRTIVNFADLLYETNRPPAAATGTGAAAPVGLQIGNGVRPINTTKIFGQGSAQESGIETDLAIEGDGFFKVTSNNSVFYTRDGSFRVNSNGQLVNSDGLIVEPAITVPAETTRIRITPEGELHATVEGQEAPVGQIALFRFINPEGLLNEGGNLYSASAAAGAETQGLAGVGGFGRLRQGFLEGSNVQVVSELVSLITAQRAYEINSRAIRAGDEMLSTTSQIVR
jgi:flagellar basal-body rod protein FlgG